MGNIAHFHHAAHHRRHCGRDRGTCCSGRVGVGSRSAGRRGGDNDRHRRRRRSRHRRHHLRDHRDLARHHDENLKQKKDPRRWQDKSIPTKSERGAPGPQPQQADRSRHQRPRSAGPNTASQIVTVMTLEVCHCIIGMARPMMAVEIAEITPNAATMKPSEAMTMPITAMTDTAVGRRIPDSRVAMPSPEWAEQTQRGNVGIHRHTFPSATVLNRSR